MEPRPIGRGNATIPAGRMARDSASMEPRPIGRGNLSTNHEEKPLEIASMEPRPIGRGNDEIPGFLLDFGQLQWSHVLLDVETGIFGSIP